MRIVYMGTPEFAVPSLARLLADGHTVAGVFTQPDKPQGRKMRLTPPPVKVLAQRHNIPVYQPQSFREDAAVRLVEELAPELIVVAAYGKILPAAVLAIPPYGCINVHGSLLPKYRGAAPIQWSVINGEKYGGVTTMKMAKELDAGDMLLAAKTEIGPAETAGDLYDRLAEMGASLLAETRESLPRITPVPQQEAEATYAPMLNKEIAVLDWHKPAAAVHNAIRGLNPWPIAVSSLHGEKIKIYLSEITNTKSAAAPGEVVLADPRKGFFVACGDGTVLRLLEIQAPGAKRMKAEDYLRGHPVEAGVQWGIG